MAYATLVPGPSHALWAWLALAWAVLSDFLDGYLARRFGWGSDFGKLLDAMLDKVLTLGGFLLAIIVGWLAPVWWVGLVLALMAVREFGITWLRLVAAKKGRVLAAEKSGKWKTAAQMASLLLLFAAPLAPEAVAAACHLLGVITFYIAAYLTISSGLGYLKAYQAAAKGGVQ